MNRMRLSAFTAIASEVRNSYSLVSRYDKTHPREKRRIVVIFYIFAGFINKFWLTKKNAKKKKNVELRPGKLHS